ncbi:MAG: heme-binding protein [Burkholderiaceae bacterium]
MTVQRVLATAALALSTSTGLAQTGTYNVPMLTPEAALKAAQAALEDCRRRGYQVAVAVVDRAGLAQAMLRDRYAGAHTPDTAVGKGWTAVSFRSNTLEFAQATQAGNPSSGIRQLPRVVAVGGGVLIDAGGSIVGAIGVSGAPGGAEDEACARAGLAAIRDSIDF